VIEIESSISAGIANASRVFGPHLRPTILIDASKTGDNLRQPRPEGTYRLLHHAHVLKCGSRSWRSKGGAAP